MEKKSIVAVLLALLFTLPVEARAATEKDPVKKYVEAALLIEMVCTPPTLVKDACRLSYEELDDKFYRPAKDALKTERSKTLLDEVHIEAFSYTRRALRFTEEGNKKVQRGILLPLSDELMTAVRRLELHLGRELGAKVED